MGLYSFMLDTSPTNGSVETTDEEKRAHAAASLEFNTKDKYVDYSSNPACCHAHQTQFSCFQAILRIISRFGDSASRK